MSAIPYAVHNIGDIGVWNLYADVTEANESATGSCCSICCQRLIPGIFQGEGSSV